jgi:hypothetical protein
MNGHVSMFQNFLIFWAISVFRPLVIESAVLLTKPKKILGSPIIILFLFIKASSKASTQVKTFLNLVIKELAPVQVSV